MSAREKLKVYTARFILCLALVAGVALLRYLVDRPPVGLMDALTCGLFLLAALRWGGALASIIAMIAIIATDYFLIDPILQLGVRNWNGLAEITGSAAVGAAIGIVVTRFLRHRGRWLRVSDK